MFFMDPLTEALIRFLGPDAKRRIEVADTIGVNEQTLYQIARGIKLKSGQPRGVGRKLRAALDAHYPNWQTEDHTVSNKQEPPKGGDQGGQLSIMATVQALAGLAGGLDQASRREAAEAMRNLFSEPASESAQIRAMAALSASAGAMSRKASA